MSPTVMLAMVRAGPRVGHGVSPVYSRVGRVSAVYTRVVLAHHPAVETVLRRGGDWMTRCCHLACRQTSVKWRKTSASVESVRKIPAKIRFKMNFLVLGVFTDMGKRHSEFELMLR